MAVPIAKKKIFSPAIINPEDALRALPSRARKPKNFPTRFIVSYSEDEVSAALKNFKSEKFRGFHGTYYAIGFPGGVLGAVRIPSGASVSAVVLEELAARGVKEVVVVGWAGSLQKNLKVGDLIICDQAIRDEGTSYHYLKPAKFVRPSRQLTKKVGSALDSLGVGYVKGTTWTTDAFYRETVHEVRQYQKEGVLTVEMEASALFAVGAYRKVDVSAIFVVSDFLADLVWRPKASKKTKEGMKTAFKAACIALAARSSASP